jgi:hypothetical protein
MAMRDKLERNVQSHLEPGERVEAIFPATRGPSPWLGVLTGFVPAIMWTTYVIVAVTDRRILVLKASSRAVAKPQELLGTFPRETRLGPVSGTYAKISLGGERYWVHRRFHGDLKTADAAGPGAPQPSRA